MVDAAIVYAFSSFTIIILTFITIKSRYKVFTTEYYVRFYRNGKVYRESIGGGYFLMPFIDKILVIKNFRDKYEKDLKIYTKDRKSLNINVWVFYKLENFKIFIDKIGLITTEDAKKQIIRIIDKQLINRISNYASKFSGAEFSRQIEIESYKVEVNDIIEPYGFKLINWGISLN